METFPLFSFLSTATIDWETNMSCVNMVMGDKVVRLIVGLIDGNKVFKSSRHQCAYRRHPIGVEKENVCSYGQRF